MPTPAPVEIGRANLQDVKILWRDGHESIFFPGEDAIVRRPQA